MALLQPSGYSSSDPTCLNLNFQLTWQERDAPEIIIIYTSSYTHQQEQTSCLDTEISMILIQNIKNLFKNQI